MLEMMGGDEFYEIIIFFWPLTLSNFKTDGLCRCVYQKIASIFKVTARMHELLGDLITGGSGSSSRLAHRDVDEQINSCRAGFPDTINMGKEQKQQQQQQEFAVPNSYPSQPASKPGTIPMS